MPSNDSHEAHDYAERIRERLPRKLQELREAARLSKYGLAREMIDRCCVSRMLPARLTLSFGAASKLQCELSTNALLSDKAVSTGSTSVTAGAKLDVVLNGSGSDTTYVLSFWRSARTWPVLTCSALTGSFKTHKKTEK